ncbi:hypothetical protein [Blastococcus sp. PRF04-17]|uniref:hypothetical protein n=1 Tax=Blastococcus sp. PRF04-17 TaxID=2933797 RepID=UPI001FF1B6BC|nr:hypothetical protein [Blastococcus sp. PRF04-17]UOY01174.1 hypothetical protein MVA48_19805 [Blastococcus sp. PRF04-17]
MTTTRWFSRRAAVVLAVATAAVGTAGWAVAADHDGAAVAARFDSEPRDDASVLPEGLHDGSRLFITKYRSVLVQVDDDGDISLIEPTGWDSCYFLHEDTVIHYPC